MRLLEKLVAVIAPHTCLGCGIEEDVLLCEGCAQSVICVPSRCYHCKAVTENYAVCRNCATHTSLRQVVVSTHYMGLAKELVHHTKYERAQAGAHEMAQFLTPLLANLPDDVILVHVPTASKRVRVRGYDQALLLTRSLSRVAHINHLACLRRVGQARQVGSSRAERLRHLQGALRVVHTSAIRGKHIVLVDDVLTTGATLETAARELKRAGAKRVSAIVFAQA